MKSPSPSPWVLIAGIGFLLPGLHAQQAPALAFGESGLSQPIPDNDPSGVARTFTASGLQVGIPYDLRVSLSVESTGAGAFNGDYYAYLMHESISGSDFRLAVLMNRVGSSVDSPNGYSDSGFRLTFSDSAPHDIHLYRVSLGGAQSDPISGLWQPDGRKVDPTTVMDTSPRSALLSPLAEMDPNGRWTLFIADLEAGGTGKLTDWEVRAVPVVPESPALVLLGLGSLALAVGARRRRS
ncbi:MAG: hypothetical protein RIT19_2344 [Verrucomicrobiota bacterium]|jgi:hypothetical protein